MIRQGHVGVPEATGMLTLLLINKAFLNWPRVISQEGSTAAWLLLPLQSLTGAALVFGYTWLLRRFPGRSIGEVADAVLGRYLGALAKLAFFLYFTLTTGLALREYTGAFTQAVLPFTPVQVILVVFTVIAVWGVTLGIEVTGRVATIFVLPIAILVTVILAAAFSNVEAYRFLPAFGPGLKKLAMPATVFATGTFSELLLLGHMNAWLRNPKDLGRVAWLGFGTATLFLEIVIVVTLGSFGIPAAHRLVVPLLELARSTVFAAFIQNMEPIFIFLWVFVAALTSIIGLYVATLSYAELFGLENLHLLAIPVGFLVFNIQLLPESLPQAIDWNETLFRRYGMWSLTAGPLFLMIIVAAVRRVKGEDSPMGDDQGSAGQGLEAQGGAKGE